MSGLAERLQYLPIVLVALVVGLVVHEVAHAGTAYAMGDPTARRAGRLSLNPLKHFDPYGAAILVVTYLALGWIFGWAKPVPVSTFYFRGRARLRMALVALAGPLSNFVLAIVVAIIWNAVHPTSTWGFTAFSIAFQLMVVLGLFNLIPIPPLDGSRVVGAMLPRRAYEMWVALDRYGIFIVIAVVLIFSRQLGDLYFAAMDGILTPFLTNY